MVKKTEGRVRGSALLERLLSAFGSKFTVAKIHFKIVPLGTDILAPPFTSKLLKSLEMEAGLTGLYESLYEKSRPRRMIFSLLREGSAPLYRRVGDGGAPILLKKNRAYRATITILYSTEDDHLSVLGIGRPRLEAPFSFGRVAVQLEKITATPLNSLSEQEYSYVKVSFDSPIILTQKIETPPWVRRPERIPEAHRLFPTPGLLAGHIVNTIIGYMGGEAAPIDKLQYYALRVFNIGVVETDYSISPVSVLYSGGENPRKPRAIVGWTIYRPLGKWHRRVFYKLLKIGELIGVGRSRAMGFGEIRVKTIKSLRAPTID